MILTAVCHRVMVVRVHQRRWCQAKRSCNSSTFASCRTDPANPMPSHEEAPVSARYKM